jgi:aspartate aminotransferase-like enzyme
LLGQRFDAVVANGECEMKGKLFRIVHFGCYDYLDTIGIIGALEQVMAAITQSKSFEVGAALKAAQEAYAKACC